jgi:NAD(P)-dependent dehydrogenase (short-subunit alcohol dehydrogenase family)
MNPDWTHGLPEEIDAGAFGGVVDVSLRGACDCTRRANGLLQADGGGTVVNVASTSGLVGTPRQHPYTAAKHGMVGLTKSLALDWAPEVRVNAIAAGIVETDLTEPVMENEALYQSLVDRTPLGRFGDPEEIAGAALFLASDMASFVTGSCVVADGGWTAR